MGISEIFKAIERWRMAKATDQKLCAVIDKMITSFFPIVTAYLIAAPIVVCLLDIEKWQFVILPPIVIFGALIVVKAVNQIWLELNEEKYKMGLKEMFGPNPDLQRQQNTEKA